MVILIALGGMILNLIKRSPEDFAKAPPDISQKPKLTSPQRFSSRSKSMTLPNDAASGPDGESVNSLTLPREKIEEYLKLHNRNAASLMAAYHAWFDIEHPENGDDIHYLTEAATNFPNDPHVQLTVLAHDVYPEDRRKWLDSFKASSPGNSLANYLSARDYFKNNQPDAAIKEILEASGKSQFADFTMESYLGGEEISRFGGAQPLITATAAMSAMVNDLSPELASMKGLAQCILDVQKQYLNSGDVASVQNLSQMTLGLADRLTGGDGGRFILSQLCGLATETIALKSLDQNTSYDFLGGETPEQRLEELKQQRLAFRELTQFFSVTFPQMTETERNSYTERVKIYGEAAAIRWLQQQHPKNNP